MDDEALLDWTAKQGRILTDSGRALRHYSAENGFPLSPEELPHHHLERGTSRAVFREWASSSVARSRDRDRDRRGGSRCAGVGHGGDNDGGSGNSPIVGAWCRPLFAGRWEHSTDVDEEVCNVQTRTLFVDLRIPRMSCGHAAERWEALGKRLHDGDVGGAVTGNDERARRIMGAMSDRDLRLFARRHVFGGYSLIAHPLPPAEEEATGETSGMRWRPPLPSCTRHHCVDWNYLPGNPRSRPNRWYVEGGKSKPGCEGPVPAPFDAWKEWSYATDEHGQCYYWERWERMEGDEHGRGLRLAMRRRRDGQEGPGGDGGGDSILIAVGDHFNYIKDDGRIRHEDQLLARTYPNASNLVELVDSAVESGDRETAASYLAAKDGGHGTISSGWTVDLAIRPWNRGRLAFDCLAEHGEDIRNSSVEVVAPRDGDGSASSRFAWEVIVGGSSWEVLECSATATELEGLLNFRVGSTSPRTRDNYSRL